MLKAAPISEGTAGGSGGSDLLATKLYARPARGNVVVRPRVIGLLDDGLSAGLILVSAPAGFGKTTLLAEWLKGRPQGSCWLSLDAADNDPVRFLSYVIAALQQAVPGVASGLVGPLRSPQPPVAEAVVTAVVNELAAVADSLILVLDDYHVITGAAVNGALTFLLENLPSNLHLVIATRADPPIPIAKLRSRGQVAEVRADDLRFTPDEAAAFLSQTMGLALLPAQVAALDERTEGWIAGLQMAALSMRGREDVDGFIRAFAGTHRFIMDYLLEEVLAHEPEEVQGFLLQTAILTRLSGSLCDAVTGGSGGQEMLEGLERRNLFVVPLDDDRRWYRYHHLFADLLQARLQQTRPQLVPVLHRQAAAWYEAHGLPDEAIEHAFAARDQERAARLVEENYPRLMERSELATLHGYMQRLAEEALRSRPLLCIYGASRAAWAGHVDEAERLLRTAESCLPAGSLAPEARALTGTIAYVRSRLAGMRGDLARAAELAHLARQSVPASDAVHQQSIAVMLGYAHFMRGDLDQASEALGEAVRLARLGGGHGGGVAALCVLARARCVQGRLREAAALYRQALEMSKEQGERWRGASSIIDAGLGELLYERNELPASLQHLQQGLAAMQWWVKPDDLALAQVTLVRVLQAQGDLGAAEEALGRAWQVIRAYSVFPEALGAVEVAQVRLWLAQSNLPEAARWARDSRPAPDDVPSLPWELRQIARARVLIAEDRPDEAASLLHRLAELAQTRGRYGRLIEIKALEALALHAQGHMLQAPIALGRALALAEPEGYVRLFVDQGEPMAELLRELKGAGAASRTYLDRLLAAFPGKAARSSAPCISSLRFPAVPLMEPLSERELEVLGLMAEGLTNQQIAARLIVALGTVKAHIHNISGKLGAQNRAQAVARAKELGLL